MDHTSLLFLALVVFVEITVLVIHHQHCSETVRKKHNTVEDKKAKLTIRIETLEEENSALLETVDNLRNQLEALESDT